jgi:beta-N-acetylhexosaminidase
VTQPSETVARRRRWALFAVAAVAAVIGVIVGSQSAEDEPAPATTTAGPPPPTCPDAIARSARRLVGQMLVVRMEDEATPALKHAIRRGEIGGVILFPTEPVDERALGRQVAALRDAAQAGDMPQPLVMIDQEGGDVKRLPEAPPDVSPAELARGKDSLAQGLDTGRALARLGIDVDLAPVLDLRASTASFIAPRAFGDTPNEVTELGVAFAHGLQRAGVAATAKHFPGLGLATVSTDEGPSTIDASRQELAPGLRPFAAAVAGSIDLVMVANATYPAYDPNLPASLSRRVIGGLLRERLGFDGVVITDDLGAGALSGAGIGETEAAVGAAQAGADLLLYALSDGAGAPEALLKALRSGKLDRDALVTSCARVTTLRDRVSPTG